MTTALLMTPYAGDFLALDSSDTWVLAAFILFISLLIYLGVPGLVGRALDDRAAEIRRQLDDARALREEAQKSLAEFERKGEDVRRQAEEMVARARADAELAAEEGRKALEASVAQRLRAAEEQIAVAETEAVRTVRNAAVDAAVAATRDVLKSSVSADAASTAMDQAISDVKSRLN